MHEICHGLGPAFARQNWQAGGHPRGDRRHLQRPRRSQGRRRRHAQLEVARRSRAPAEGSAARNTTRRTSPAFSARSVRHGRSARPRGDDGVQLSLGAAAPSRTPTGGTTWCYDEDAGRHRARSPRNCSSRKRPATARRADAWFAKYDKMPDELTAALAGARDVPIDVDPVFSFSEPVL